MTGSLKIKETSPGKRKYYIRLKYKDPQSHTWKTKDIKTGLDVKGNQRRAKNMIPACINEYRHLEQPTFIAYDIDPKIDLCDFLDLWIQEKSCDICENTRDTYINRIATIKRYFANQPIMVRDVKPKDLNDFFHYALKYGKVSQKDQSLHPLSVRTVRSCKSILYAAFNDAVIKGLIPFNPVRDLKVTSKKNRDFSEEMLFLSEDEIRELLVFLGNHDTYYFLKPIVFVGVYYGLRREEILGLKWSAINFSQETITIRHTVTGSKTIYTEDKTKTKSGYRTLNLFSTASACFKEIKTAQKENKKFFGNTYQDTQDYVFTHEDGTPYRPDYLTKKFKKAMAEFGRPEITLHKLRHTCASLLIDKGWDIKKIQYWLGLSDASVLLNIYAHYMRHKSNIAENDLKEMTENVEDLFK